MEGYYSETVKLFMQVHYKSLSERQRRQYAAVERKKLGFGGQSYIVKLLGISPKTLRKGERELEENAHLPAITTTRQRAEGGGRKKIWDTVRTISKRTVDSLYR